MVRCQVVLTEIGGQTGIDHIFAAPPSVGEQVLIALNDKTTQFQVDKVVHHAENALPDSPQASVVIYVSKSS